MQKQTHLLISFLEKRSVKIVSSVAQTTILVGNEQVLCLCPTVLADASLSPIVINDKFVAILFGGTALSSGMGLIAAVVPPASRF